MSALLQCSLIAVTYVLVLYVGARRLSAPQACWCRQGAAHAVLFPAAPGSDARLGRDHPDVVKRRTVLVALVRPRAPRHAPDRGC